MSPWHRFWFPEQHDSDVAHSRDAALWTPQALMQTQRELWQHAAQATEDWWRYWQAAWPSLPLQPPAGVVTPPLPAGDDSELPAHDAEAAAPTPRRRATPPKPPRPSARGR